MTADHMTRPKSIALDFDKTIFGGEFTSTDVVEGPPIVGLAAAGDVDGIRMHFEHLKGSKGRL